MEPSSDMVSFGKGILHVQLMFVHVVDGVRG